uniref:Dendritic cell-specific transmembrane protein-like domain-containing protein n=1 Tax=Gouania willdenowi TaxID=441366 RepID=A0A8C5EYM6_GOUWI
TASRFRSSYQALRGVLVHLWGVYSSPAPWGRDLLTLLCLCFTLSVVTGFLLHHWLSHTLRYQHTASLQTSCVHSLVLFLVTSLSHPLRCVLTLTLPTVCTKQGRKLLLSTSIMVLVLNVVPNISLNVGAVTRVLKCTAEGFTRTLLNSSHPLNQVRQDLVDEVIRVKREDLSMVKTLRTLNHVTRVDVSQVRSRLEKMISQIEDDFSQATSVLKDYKLMSNRVLAAVFVVLLIVESARYLKSYLMVVQVQNKDLVQRKAPDGGQRPSCEVTGQEVTSSFLSLFLVTLHYVSMLLLLLMDYIVYHIVQIIVPWFMDFPPTSAVISVDYTVSWFPPVLCLLPKSCYSRELTSFHKDYRWDFSPEPELCHVTTSPPNPGVVLLLGFLWILSYCLVFLEVYAKRLRRNISASFFREQEEERSGGLQRNRGKVGKMKKNKDMLSFVTL